MPDEVRVLDPARTTRELAEACYPHGVTLRCRRCGTEATADVATAARYFREGWPVCCGMTMDASAPAPTPGAGP